MIRKTRRRRTEKADIAAEPLEFYENCNRQELEASIKSRTGHKVIQEFSLKKLRNWLLKLDACATFRSMGLPTELRLEIEEKSIVM